MVVLNSASRRFRRLGLSRLWPSGPGRGGRTLLIAIGGFAALGMTPSIALAAPRPAMAVDLGTLGGTDSFATAQNALGQVVGDSLTADGFQHGFLWTPGKGMVDLGTLVGSGAGSAANAVSNTGQVVGYSYLCSSCAEPHAFSWTPSGGMADLGTLGGRTSQATAVNDFGVVVGISDTADGSAHAFRWTRSGGMVDLGTLGGANSGAVAVNVLGQILGVSSTATGDSHVFRWAQNTGMLDLGTLPGGESSQTGALNLLGQVAGLSGTASGHYHATLWPYPGRIIDLGALGDTDSAAVALNALGQVTGVSYLPAGNEHAFSWTKQGGMTDLGTLGGGESEARAINLSGEIVGRSNPAGSPTLRHGGNSEAFAWTPPRGMTRLGSLGGIRSDAIAVNDLGQIAGQSETADGLTHAVVWSPWK